MEILSISMDEATGKITITFAPEHVLEAKKFFKELFSDDKEEEIQNYDQQGCIACGCIQCTCGNYQDPDYKDPAMMGTTTSETYDGTVCDGDDQSGMTDPA